jgi:hypothetical protein
MPAVVKAMPMTAAVHNKRRMIPSCENAICRSIAGGPQWPGFFPGPLAELRVRFD